MDEALKRGAFRVHQLGRRFDQAPRIERGDVTPTEPLRFHHDQGGRLTDVIGTTSATVLYSDRIVGALGTGGFTGWDTYPVEVYDEHGDLVRGYHGLVVTGRSGPLVDSLSPVMERAPFVPDGPIPLVRVGIRFLPETWDGSDVFRPLGTGFTLVTQEVRDALAAVKPTNLELTRITEIENLVFGDELEEYERKQQ